MPIICAYLISAPRICHPNLCQSNSGQDFNYVIVSVVCTNQTPNFNYFSWSVINRVGSPIVPSLRCKIFCWFPSAMVKICYVRWLLFHWSQLDSKSYLPDLRRVREFPKERGQPTGCKQSSIRDPVDTEGGVEIRFRVQILTDHFDWLLRPHVADIVTRPSEATLAKS